MLDGLTFTSKLVKSTCRSCDEILGFLETSFSILWSALRINLLGQPGLDKLAVLLNVLPLNIPQIMNLIIYCPVFVCHCLVFN